MKKYLKKFMCLIGLHWALGCNHAPDGTMPCEWCGKKVKVMLIDDMMFTDLRCSKCGQKVPTLHTGGPM